MPGETIGNFRIVERLGAGGMGEVQIIVHERRVQRCYLDALKKDPTLGGKLMAKPTLGTDGRATDTSAIGVSDQVSRCVASVIASLKFRAAVGGPVDERAR